MFGRPQKKQIVDVQRTVSLAETNNARGVVAKDYEFADRAEFIRSLNARLERLIAAGATDVETIGVLDAELANQRRIELAHLDSQRSDHIDACKRIVGIARMNVTEAGNTLKRAVENLDEAQKLFDELEAKLHEFDPNRNHHA